MEQKEHNSSSDDIHVHSDQAPVQKLLVSYTPKIRSPSLYTPLNIASRILAAFICLSWIPAVHAKAPLREIISPLSLDPVSLITLFFDEPEKELLSKSGDLTLLSGLGLFVNPSTLWNEYKTLLPGQGLQYYNPGVKIRSYIENDQVNTFIGALGTENRDKGIIVDLCPLKNRRKLLWPKSPSWEWWLLRPVMLMALVAIAGVSEDFWGIGSIAALLVGQFIAISSTIYDGWDLPNEGNDNKNEQNNVFFLQNNVTLVVRCRGDLFRKATSHLTSRKNDPVVFRIITTIIFLLGILFVGFTTFNFKVAYLIAHGLQAIIIAFASKVPIEEEVIINRTIWRQVEDHKIPTLRRRKEAYVWVCQATGAVDTNWLDEWDLARGGTLDFVNQEIDRIRNEGKFYKMPPRKDVIECIS